MDPNKYKKNENIRPDTLFDTIKSLIFVVLMCIGLGGISAEFFKENGLIVQLLSFLFQSTGTILLIPVIIFAFWLINRWISASNKSKTKKSGNLPMYMMILIGAYYAFRLITNSSFYSGLKSHHLSDT